MTTEKAPKYCYLDIAIGDRTADRVVVELYVEAVPKTCLNFATLCIGEKAPNGAQTIPGTETKMSYVGSTFHRVIPDFMIQGGDYTNHNGTGGHSIYGAEFQDESFEYKCDGPGLLCMANRGPNTNGSQFFITCAPTPHLDGKHVVFGRVVRGMNAVRRVEHTPTGDQDKPRSPVRITDCGSLSELPPVEAQADGDAFADYPQDVHPPLSDAEKVEAAETVRQIGNKLFLAGTFSAAVDKYEKALRYLGAAVATSATGTAIRDKQLACHNNAAQCFLKLEKFADARSSAGLALQIDPKNVKARFRRGQAYAALHEYEEAEADLKACLEADPSNADVAARLGQIHEATAARKKKLAAGYAKMFS